MKNLNSFLTKLAIFPSLFIVATLCTACPDKTDTGKPAAYDDYFGDGDELCDTSPSDYGVDDTTRILYVSPTGDNTTGTSRETAFTTVQAAIDYRSNPTNFTSDTVAIYLSNDTTFEESIKLDDTNDSNTIFVGCSDSATIAALTDGTETAATHAVEIDLNAENVGFYNLTIKGIGGSYNTSATADDTECTDGSTSTPCPYLETSTVYLNMAKNFTFEDVAIANNYYQAILVSGSTTYGNIINTTLSDPFDGAGDYDDMIGIRVSGSTSSATTITNLSIADPVDYGVIIIDGNANIEDSTLDGILNWAVFLDKIDSQPTATVTNTTLTNSHLGIYSTDASTLNLFDVTIDTSNDLGLISCQYDSTDFSQSSYNITNGSISNIMFDTVTVEGSGATLSSCSTYNAQMNGYSGDCTASSTQLCDF